MTNPKIIALLAAAALLPNASSFAPSSRTAVLRLPTTGPISLTSPTFTSSHPKVAMMKPSFMTAGVEEEKIPEGDATVTQLIFNLVKGIVGAGGS
jgi:hypothetical protein